MSLFGFVQDIGRRLLDKDQEATDRIKEHILAHSPGFGNLEVRYENGIVSLSWRRTNRDAFQTCVLMAGNVQGVIEKGDTLWKIAAKYLGGGNRYPEILEPNREVILDPDKIPPRQRIRIPAK